MCSKSVCVYATSCPCVRVCATMRSARRRTAFRSGRIERHEAHHTRCFLTPPSREWRSQQRATSCPALASIRWPWGRIPDPCLALFHLYGICKPFLIAGLGGPAHVKSRGRIPDISHLFKSLHDPASCLRPRNAGCCSSGLHPTSGRQGAEGRIPGPVS